MNTIIALFCVLFSFLSLTKKLDTWNVMNNILIFIFFIIIII